MTAAVWAEIDFAAIDHNLQILRELVGPTTQLMVVVKANAYGHGATLIARRALRAGASQLAVARVEELEELRAEGIRAPVLVLSELPVEQAERLLASEGTATVCSLEAAQSLAAAARAAGGMTRIHVKVNTGMNRIGVPVEEAPELLRALGRLPELEVEGLYTHFATAEEPHAPATRSQVGRFRTLVELLRRSGSCPPVVHAANSAACILMPESRLDLVRLGLAVYGLHPSEATRSEVALHPALSLRARVSQVVPVPAGEGVSYGHTFVPDKDCLVATLPVGYADGYPRILSNRAPVLLGGKRCPVAGNVTMDQLMVRVEAHSGVARGDVATLIGRDGAVEVTADELAELAETINYEIVTGISRRVPRVVTGDERGD